VYRLLYYSRFVLRWNERGEVEGAIQDFGVACQVGARGTPLSLAGNATYRPPEYRSLVERANPKQEDIAAVTTPAMDVFAMGKILTELLKDESFSAEQDQALKVLHSMTSRSPILRPNPRHVLEAIDRAFPD